MAGLLPRCSFDAFFRQSISSLRLAARPRRYLSISADASSSSSAGPNPKPYRKVAATPLRRTAAASLPIRSNPTPTRSNIQAVFTLATAERYLFSRLRGRLPAASQLLHEAFWVPRWRDGEVFVFENGSVVCWGLGEEDARQFAQEVIGGTGVEVGHLKEAETEELDFVMDPTETTRLQGDLIILGDSPSLSSPDSFPSSVPQSALPTETLPARYAFSQALSRSTALSALEVALDDYLSSVAALPNSLETTGKPGLGREALIKKLGRLMKFRQGLNLNRENFLETPDFYWAEPELEAYFKSLSNALEVKIRTTSVNDKITYAAEVQSILRQLLTESTAHRMELVIIALITVEVIVALIRDGPELWHIIIS
ncbi:hypothetical protein NEOLEDRAFT_1141095 [Neolentinus lepideus HHB14362 ss-1]|uniref:DUF155 domain-containing protein n=1 Tax=Neolentinus lepideus HHB14362 ss-1 TaxID=1314782 RepID=A0A165NUW1_9AGAM|nr:hypothetical protein NEOLEDRAFT_1141095 [Neolentinus lepideus HHB14362 ss-1]